MFADTHLINHLDRNQSIRIEAGCFIELNQNDLENVDTIGVFKYGDYSEAQLRQWPTLPNYYWVHKNAVTSLQNNELDINDMVYFGDRRKSDYFSLVDCFTQFRPRSGINKLVQPMAENQTFIDDFKSVRRPRYYPASVHDRFKYWTSWNTDIGLDAGVSKPDGSIKYAAPFIVYKEPVAANRITVKIQTGVGESVSTKNSSVAKSDPLSNTALSTIPKQWKIQYLDITGTWQDAMVFGNWDVNSPLKKEFGHLDIAYMVRNPGPWKFFVLKDYIPSVQHLPLYAYDGEAFCVGRDQYNIGRLWVWSGQGWVDTGDIRYDWTVVDPTMNPEDYAVKDLVDPIVYNPNLRDSADDQYTGFVMIKGLRILVDSMMARDKPFELIELSARLFANVSSMTMSYEIDKAISDSESILPVGGLSVSSGSVLLSNADLALNREMKYDVKTHRGSIIAGRVRRNTKFLFYEIIREVNVDGVLFDKFIPVKNLYVVEHPVVVSGTEDINIPLRDLNFRFEEERCPNLLLKDCSLTKAVAVLLDYIGFSNYIFHVGERSTWINDTSPLDTIFPYLFTNETQTIAEVLDQLSIASQCAIFFDEYNNLVVMPREHFKQPIQYTLRGSRKEIKVNGVTQYYEYPTIEDMNANAFSIADAEITFTHRDLARGNLPLESLTESGTREPGEIGNIMAYRPAEVWNIGKSGQTTLSAAPLNSPLSADKPVYDPSVQGGRIANNSFDLGIYAQYYPFSGMASLNAELIEFDAKEYMINGSQVWVESQVHLNELIGRSQFGQMVYPTGKMRIKTEIDIQPNNSLVVSSHGRGRLGTTIASHDAEPTGWLNSPTFTFTDTAIKTLYGLISYENWTLGKYSGGGANEQKSNYFSASNYIYNSLHSRNAIMGGSPMTIAPANVGSLNTERRIMRSSALTFRGHPDAGPDKVYMKTHVIPGSHYNLFGTRVGIIGSQFDQTDGSTTQEPRGTMPLGSYTPGPNEDQTPIFGAGGGLVILSNRHVTSGSVTSNDGYYFEILALTAPIIRQIEGSEDTEASMFANINFYKINRGKFQGSGAVENVAVKLFGTYGDILVTSGSQTVRDRTVPSDQTVVFDLSVEVTNIGVGGNYQRVFYLYVNDACIGVVYDPVKGKGYHVERGTSTEIGVFARGKSELQFEHIYAVGTNTIDPEPIYMDHKIMSRPRAFQVFSPSAIYSAKALSGGVANNSIYFEEFGSMVREVRAIDAPFDLNPVAISTIAKMPIFDRTYTISGYYADPYIARFLLWSQADRLMDLTAEESKLSILGLPFQNNEPVTLTIDDYLAGNFEGIDVKVAHNLSNEFRKKLLAVRAGGATEKIAFESQYIQSREYAIRMLRWLKGFMGVERIELDVLAFCVPHIQLGDIVAVDLDIPYHNEEPLTAADPATITPVDPVYTQHTMRFQNSATDSRPATRFMVQSISVDRNIDGPEYALHLVEMPDDALWRADEF